MLWVSLGGVDGAADRAVRFAWLAALLLGALLLGPAAASAASPPAAGAPLALEVEAEAESEEGEEGEDECAEAEEEFGAGEIDAEELQEACEEDGRDPSAREECVLRSFHAHAVASSKPDKLKLTVGYTTFEPSQATVEVRKGSTLLGSVHRHLGRSGVVRIVKALHGPAPRRVTVKIKIPSAPSSCAKSLAKTVPVPKPHH